jgi:hypothetical protein
MVGIRPATQATLVAISTQDASVPIALDAWDVVDGHLNVDPGRLARSKKEGRGRLAFAMGNSEPVCRRNCVGSLTPPEGGLV